MRKQIVLVTGGAGFIGSHIVERLISAGQTVRVLDDLSTGRDSNLDGVRGRVEFLHGSVTDPGLLRRAMEGVEVTFHLAAKVFVPESFEQPAEYERVNVEGTSLVLEAARTAGVERVVFSSTCAVYGNPARLPVTEDAPIQPLSPYARTKLDGEQLGMRHAARGGAAFIALRYFNVYGPRQDPRSAYSGVISRFADVLQRRETPTIYGDGSQTRDFIHVHDVAEGNLRAASSAAGSTVVNLGTGVETSICNLLQLMQAATGQPSVANFQPARNGEVARSVADISRLQRVLDWSPHVAIAQGIDGLLVLRSST